MLLSCCLLAVFSVSPPLIIPHPKEAVWRDASRVVEHCTIVCGRSMLDRTAAGSIAREFVAYGMQPPKISFWPPAHGDYIVIGEPRTRRWLRRLLSKDVGKIPGNDEGYYLTTRPSGHLLAVVASASTHGTLYGAQTLCQMLSVSDSHLQLRQGTVRDWPSLRWRGLLLFLGNHALHFHKKLITNVLTRFKMNHLLLECEQAKWDATKDVAPDWAMSKSDLDKELLYAKRSGLTVWPLVNSVGHMKWLLLKTKYQDLAEDAHFPAAICPTDARTYPLLFSLYKEVAKTFGAGVLHIGGDEVNYSGRYPWRSKAKYPRQADLFLAHVLRLNRWLRQRGMRMAMWDDMTLTKGEAVGNANATTMEEAVLTRHRIPKDTLLFDWYYWKGGNESRLRVLRAAGFKHIIGSTYKMFDNVYWTAKALTDSHCDGLLETTWVGYNSQEKNIHTYESDFATIVVVADEAWNGGTIPIDKLGYQPVDILRGAYGLSLPGK